LPRTFGQRSISSNSTSEISREQQHSAIAVLSRVGLLRIQGPFDASRPQDSPSRRKVFTCRPSATLQEEACAKQILTALGRQAFRRPVTPLDMESLMNFYVDGRKDGTFDDGIELALRRLLTSPQFLVRAEKEPANLAIGKSYRITDLELASRLSFFLWSTGPDETLINLASQNRLSNPTVLEQQVKRMLSDSRSEALVTNFADQLLYLRNLTATSPDGVYYPNWDDELRKGFRRETEMLFESIMREDRNVVDLLTANYTFVNERLAKHYGIPNVYGGQFRKVTLGPGHGLSPRAARPGKFSCRSRGYRISGRLRSSAASGCLKTYLALRLRSRRRTFLHLKTASPAPESSDIARADDAASQGRALCELPQADGSDWFRFGEF
jgi:hypothetical protein